MKQWLAAHFGQSWKTTLISYLMAIILAVQPLLDVEVDLSNKYQFIKYVIKLIFAVLLAIFGKQAADSSQVKDVHKEVRNSLYDLRNQGRQ